MGTIWIVLGILFFIGEIFTPGFYLASLGISAIVASLPAQFGTSLTVQVVVFGLSIVITMVLLRPVLYRTFMRKHQVKTNVDRLIGRIVKVERDITPDEKGRVKVDGESWFALSDQELKTGEKAEIVAVSGTVMTVRKV